MTNKVKQYHQDKEKYKQKYSVLKNQVMSQEADKTRIYKQISVEDPMITPPCPDILSPVAKKSFSDLRDVWKLKKQVSNFDEVKQ